MDENNFKNKYFKEKEANLDQGSVLHLLRVKEQPAILQPVPEINIKIN